MKALLRFRDLPSRALTVGLVLAGLMLLMLGLRIFPGWYYLVRPDWEVRLPDPDAYFHYRQALYSLQHFPQLMRWDDFSFYPEMQRNDAAGLYDLTLAGLAKIVALSGMQPQRALWWVCLWFPPLCATAIMPLVYLLVRRHGTTAIGLVMSLWYVLLPGLTLAHMTLGICDHHVVEMLFSVLCIILLQRLVERERSQPSAWWRPAWVAALPIALLQFTWLGAPLFLAIFGLTTFGQLAADVLGGAGPRPLVRAGVRYWLAFLILTAALGALFPTIVLAPPLWQASLAGTGVLLVILAGLGWWFDTPRIVLRPITRLTLALGVLVALTAVGLMLSPRLLTLVSEGLGPKPLTVAEHQEVTARLFFGVTSLAGILGLLAPLVGIATGMWRRPGWWIGVLPSLAFIALWYRTHDYSYQGALHAILLAGFFFGALATVLPSARWLPRWLGIRPILAACTLAVVLFCWPADWTAPWTLNGEWYETESGMPNEGWIEAMRWLRTHTPAPPPPAPHLVRGQAPRGRVGVLTDWTNGQFVNTLAALPATSSRYPVIEGMVPFFLRAEESVRSAPLRGSTVAAAVRHVVISPRTIGDSFGSHRAVLGLQSTELFGRASFVDGQGRKIGVPTLGEAYDTAFATRLLREDGNGLAHFRLIFESQQQSFLRLTCLPETRVVVPRSDLVRSETMRAEAVRLMQSGIWKEQATNGYLGQLLAEVKIFEQVEGARLEGPAPVGATVTVQIPLRLRTSGRAWLYRQSFQVGGDGRFRLVVPYSTDPPSSTDLELNGQAQLILAESPTGPSDNSAAQPLDLAIPETAVQNGERVTVRGWPGQPPAAKTP